MLEWIEANRFLIDSGLITTLLAMSMFVAFHAGVMSLGSVGFMAAGGYTTAILTAKHGLPMVVGIPAGVAVGASLAWVFSLVILRLSGIYLALGTFALAQATIIFIETAGFTNGVHGIFGIERTYTTWWSVVALVVIVAVAQLVRHSHYGRALKTVRLDPVVALGLGVSTSRYQRVAFVLSGAIASYAGALEAHETSVVSPSQYNFTVLVIALTYAMIGGADHWAGTLGAAVTLTILREWTRDAGTDTQNLVYGIVLVVLLRAFPGGLADPRLKRAVRRLRRTPRPGSADVTPIGSPAQ